MSQTTIEKSRVRIGRPLLKEKRLLIWKKMRGLWQNRKPDPVKELNKMRQEWDRK